MARVLRRIRGPVDNREEIVSERLSHRRGHHSEVANGTAPSSQAVSDALVVWHGWGRTSWPHHDEDRVVEMFGKEDAVELLTVLHRLENEFFESDAVHVAPDLTTMGDRAAAEFRHRHPELSDDAVAALRWCYTFTYK